MLVAKSSSKLDFSLAYTYLYGFTMKILMLVAKSSSKLDFSLAYTYLYGLAMKILALAENKNSTARNKSELFFS